MDAATIIRRQTSQATRNKITILGWKGLMQNLQDASMQIKIRPSDHNTGKTIVSEDGRTSVKILYPLQGLVCKKDLTWIAVYEGLFEGREAVVKVFLRTGQTQQSSTAENEVKALKTLSEKGCKHAPEFFAYFVRKGDGVVATSEHYVVMSKVPGVCLEDANLKDDMMVHVRKAFRKAIKDVHACGVDNGSHHMGNIMFDAFSRKCYIIDFERAEFVKEPGGWCEDPDVWMVPR